MSHFLYPINYQPAAKRIVFDHQNSRSSIGDCSPEGHVSIRLSLDCAKLFTGLMARAHFDEAAFLAIWHWLRPFPEAWDYRRPDEVDDPRMPT
ncbi:MAG: hypothetical protein JNN07_26895 [Verrucomicrobiales bacterium]|nr:hypothetical protein [Verrucomicrobiales bacterium]